MSFEVKKRFSIDVAQIKEMIERKEGVKIKCMLMTPGKITGVLK